MTLTDEDKESIRQAQLAWDPAVSDGPEPYIYLAGLAAGMERAAKVCDARSTDRDDDAEKCAAAIRAQE